MTDVQSLVGIAANSNLPADERASAVITLLDQIDVPGLAVDAEVVRVVADRANPQAALAAALCSVGPGRADALRAAVTLRSAEGPGDQALSNALAELQDTPALVQSLTDEVAHHAATAESGSPTMSGAWGLHLVKVFDRVGIDSFKDFVEYAHESDHKAAMLVKHALAAAPVPEELAKLRSDLQYWYRKGHEAWIVSGSALR